MAYTQCEKCSCIKSFIMIKMPTKMHAKMTCNRNLNFFRSPQSRGSAVKRTKLAGLCKFTTLLETSSKLRRKSSASFVRGYTVDSLDLNVIVCSFGVLQSSRHIVDIIGWWESVCYLCCVPVDIKLRLVQESKIWIPAGSEAKASHFCCWCLKARRP